ITALPLRRIQFRRSRPRRPGRAADMALRHAGGTVRPGAAGYRQRTAARRARGPDRARRGRRRGGTAMRPDPRPAGQRPDRQPLAAARAAPLRQHAGWHPGTAGGLSPPSVQRPPRARMGATGMTPLHRINPFATPWPAQPEDWLAALPGPSLIHLHGADPTRVRVLVTLLHGNEPSGLIATHQWLREGREAVESTLATDLVLILASVEAARTPPRYSHRHLPGQRDLNRCFRAPWHDAPGRLAQAILAELVALGPEAVIDLHNTSGRSPAFAVAALDDQRHRTLAGMFCDHMIVTDLRLGA